MYGMGVHESKSVFRAGNLLLVLVLNMYQSAFVRSHSSLHGHRRHGAHSEGFDSESSGGQLVFAELEDLETASKLLPPHHPPLTESYAKGLPQTCLTYEERYRNYESTSLDMGELKARNPKSKHAILLRVFFGTIWTQDLILNTRALLTEGHRAAWHVWILYQASTASDSELNDERDKIFASIPSEFRAFIYMYTENQLHNEFPLAYNYKHKEPWVDYNWREYLGATHFMQKHPGYDFAFIVESDVRYTGEDWGSFLSIVLLLSRKTLGLNYNLESIETHPQMMSDRRLWQPDFIAFSPFLFQLEDVNTENVMDNSTWRFPKVVKYFTTLHGLSQRMNKIIVEESQRGNGGFAEQFLPTVAFLSDVNTVIVPIGVWEDAFPLHCCESKITEIYNNWYLRKSCLASTLLHPVKNNDPAVWSF